MLVTGTPRRSEAMGALGGEHAELAAQRAGRIPAAGAVLPDAGRLDVHGAATSLCAMFESARPETISWQPTCLP